MKRKIDKKFFSSCFFRQGFENSNFFNELDKILQERKIDEICSSKTKKFLLNNKRKFFQKKFRTKRLSTALTLIDPFITLIGKPNARIITRKKNKGEYFSRAHCDYEPHQKENQSNEKVTKISRRSSTLIVCLFKLVNLISNPI